MDTRNHILLLVMLALIIGLLYQFLPKHAPEVIEVPITPEETYFIRIERASWGLNCLDPRFNTRPADPLLAPDEGILPLKPDNVLTKLSGLCNSKTSCTIKNVPASFDATGDKNPQPECDKILEVEYRCFTFDRLWKKVADKGDDLTIRCQQKE